MSLLSLTPSSSHSPHSPSHASSPFPAFPNLPSPAGARACWGQSVRPLPALTADVISWRNPGGKDRRRFTVRATSAEPRLPGAEEAIPLPGQEAALASDPSLSSVSAKSGCPFFSKLSEPLPPKGKLEEAWDTVNVLAMYSQYLFNHNVDSLERHTNDLNGRAFGVTRSYGKEGLLLGTAPLAKAVLADEVAFPGSAPALAEALGEEQLLSVPPDKHASLRRLLAPAFAPDEIEKYTPQVQELAVKHLDALAAASATAEEEGVVHWPHAQTEMELFTLEVICRLVAGLRISEEELRELKVEFEAMVSGVFFPLRLDLPFVPYKAGVEARGKILARIDNWVEASRKRNCEGVEPKGVLDELVAFVGSEGQRLTNQQLRENLLLFLFAGFDTTGATITAMMSFVHMHPEVKEKLQAEQAKVVAKWGPRLSSKALREMRYAECVAKETLRLRPVLPALQRAFAHDMEFQGLKFRKGETVEFALRVIAQDDPVWAGKTGDLAPSVFNPGRWLDGGSANQLPFGHGSHLCLGMNLAFMEAKTFLAVLVRGYEIVSVSEPAEWVYKPLLEPDNGLPVILKKCN